MKKQIVAHTIDSAINYNGFSIQFLANILKDPMGYQSPCGAFEFIARMRNDGGFHHKRQNPKRDERNLSILLYALGTQPNDEVINILRDGRDFQYPPENGVPYKTVLELYEQVKERSSNHLAKSTLEDKLE